MRSIFCPTLTKGFQAELITVERPRPQPARQGPVGERCVEQIARDGNQLGADLWSEQSLQKHEVTNVHIEASKKTLAEATSILSEPMKQSEGRRVRWHVGVRLAFPWKGKFCNIRDDSVNTIKLSVRSYASTQKVAVNGQLPSITNCTHPDFSKTIWCEIQNSLWIIPKVINRLVIVWQRRQMDWFYSVEGD